MTTLEGAVVLILMLLALPDFCRRINRPGLLYPLYIVAGVAAGAFMSESVRHVWHEVGQFGFILLLFSVGLEIELPEKRESLTALRRAAGWMIWQLPLLAGLAWVGGVSWVEAVVAAVALASTSVGMAFPLWKAHAFKDRASRKQFLEWMVGTEVLAILLFAVAGPVLSGAVWWRTLAKFIGIIIVVVAAAQLARRGAPHLARLLERGLKLQVHFLVALLFVAAAIGERLGLSAPKTAFVIGMFISRSTDEEVALNEKLEPVRDRLFVPVFFFGLGTLIEPRFMLTPAFVCAIAAAGLMYFLRRAVFGWTLARSFKTGAASHLITLPVLTLAAVAVEVLARAGASPAALAWTLAGGLTLTLIAAFTRVDGGVELAEVESSMSAPEAWDQVNETKKP